MPIDDIGKMVNIGTLLAFVIVCIAVIMLRRTNPDQAAALPHALGAAGADPWRRLQWLHDVPAGLDQLGPADHLAGDRAGCVLHLRPEAQQGASPAGERWKIAARSRVLRAFRTARKVFLFYSRWSLAVRSRGHDGQKSSTRNRRQL